MSDISDVAADQVDGTTTLEWREEIITIPASLDDCDIEVLEAWEAGKATVFVREFVGEAQYQSLKAAGLVKVRDLGELGDAIAVALGFKKSGE